jgi:hypothetical protein
MAQEYSEALDHIDDLEKMNKALQDKVTILSLDGDKDGIIQDLTEKIETANQV